MLNPLRLNIPSMSSAIPTRAANKRKPKGKYVSPRDKKLTRDQKPSMVFEKYQNVSANKITVNQTITPPITGVPSFFLCKDINIGASLRSTSLPGMKYLKRILLHKGVMAMATKKESVAMTNILTALKMVKTVCSITFNFQLVGFCRLLPMVCHLNPFYHLLGIAKTVIASQNYADNFAVITRQIHYQNQAT